MSFKHVALQLCTCTWIEIMTGLGLTLYLLYLQNYNLAALTVGLFAPLIGFHFAIDRLLKDDGWSDQNRMISLRRRSLED